MSQLPSGIIKKAIEDRGYCHIKVSGTSMLPSYTAGDRVKIIKPKEVDVNDVVLIEYMDSLILHRVVMKNESQVLTRGDNNLFLDGEVPLACVIGKTELPTQFYEVSDRIIFDRVVFQFWDISREQVSEASMALIENFKIDARFGPNHPFDEEAIHVAIVQNSFSSLVALDEVIEKIIHREKILVVHFNIKCAQDERFEGQSISKFQHVVRLGTLDTCLKMALSDQVQLFLGYMLGKCEIK